MPFLVAHRQRRHVVACDVGSEGGGHLTVGGAERVVVGFADGDSIRVERTVVSRDRVVRRALEHGEVRCLLGDDRDRLNARRPGADHGDPLAGEVDRLVRPLPGVEEAAAVVAHALELGGVGRREAAGRHHDESRCDLLARVGGDPPRRGRLVEVGTDHPGLERDVPAQVEPVGDVPGVLQDLGLRRVPLGPLPLLLEIVVEPVRVLHALGVTARARVPVPVPRAPDVVPCLEHPSPQPQPPSPVQHVHPAEPGPHDHYINIDCGTLNGVRQGGRGRVRTRTSQDCVARGSVRSLV